MDASESRVVGPQGEVLFVRRNLSGVVLLGLLGLNETQPLGRHEQHHPAPWWKLNDMQ